MPNLSTIMEKPGISESVKRFLLLSIPSVPYLEALLILRNQKTQLWDADKIAPLLYLNSHAAQGLLDSLQENGVLSRELPGQYRYNPRTPEIAALIEELADAYPQHLIEITNLVHAKLNKKAHKFANAFIWEKGK